MTGTPGRSGFNLKPAHSDRSPVDGPPSKPQLSQTASQKWDELIEQLPATALRRVDVHQLRILAELLARFDKLTSQVDEQPDNLAAGRLLISTAQHIHRLSSTFGLSPADRQRLHLTDQDQVPDDAAEWIAS